MTKDSRIKSKLTISIILVSFFLSIFTINSFAHSGRTDASGGHRDNKNRSGLGSYHYHHGYGPHLHPNGECPYAPKQETQTLKEEIPEPTIKEVSYLKITSDDITLEVGKTYSLSVTLLPEDATDKLVTWSSSDPETASVNNSGVVTAKKAGKVTITATTHNGKTDSIDLTVKNEELPISNNLDKTTRQSKLDSSPNNNHVYEENKKGNPVDIVIGVIIIGIIVYIISKRKRK